MTEKHYSRNLIVKLGILRRDLGMYKYSLWASLLVSLIAVVTITICTLVNVEYADTVHYAFTILVSLVAIDIASQIFLAMWIIDSIELLDSYIRFCKSTNKCIRVIEEKEKGSVTSLIDYPLWFIILYVVSVTFVTSAAYIVMVLVKYGYIDGLFPYEEGIFASSLLYMLGFVLGAVASLIIVLPLLRLGEYIGVHTLYIIGLIFSTKYLVDLASLVYSISMVMSALSLILTLLSLYYVGRIFRGISILEKYLSELES